MGELPAAVGELAAALRSLGWIGDLFVGGSAATGDYHPGVSDLDLVAVTTGRVDAAREGQLVAVHTRLDGGAAAGLALGCVYVDEAQLEQERVLHPTWTHGALVRRALSGVARAELVRHGCAVFGRPPGAVLPAVSDQDVRRAVHAELTGYWSRAAARPWWWLDPVMVDLGLTSMARGRHGLASGQLMTKTAAIDAVDAPAWLVAHVRARRAGQQVTSPRWRSAWWAWRDAARTTAAARRWTPRAT